MLFNFSDNDTETDTLMWSQGEINSVSNGNNLPNKGSGIHKRGNSLVLWDTNVEWGELTTTSAVVFPVSLHN